MRRVPRTIGPHDKPEQASEIVGWSTEEEERFVNTLEHLEADLGRVERWCAEEGWPMPAKMTEEKREGLLRYLATDEGRNSYLDANE